MQYRKVYVDISLNIDRDGTVQPRRIRYEDGTFYDIDQVLEVCHAASMNVGGVGTRYRVKIRGYESYLFDENGRWFVEAKEV